MTQGVDVNLNISIVMVKAIFNKKNNLFTSKLDLNLCMTLVVGA
jgi:hypothetical protein